MSKTAIVIGAGFSGLSVSACLAKAGFKVTVLEKHDHAGGRARIYKEDGFTFDMGPSWYWMPDVFERYFALFGKKVSDYYTLIRLDPSYAIYWGKDDFTPIPAGVPQLIELFEKLDPGSGERLVQFLKEGAYKYEVGINKLVYKPGLSLLEFADKELIGGIFKLDVFSSISEHVRKLTRNPRLIQLLEFPVLFLGALPENTPALYSLMNYADMALGTWFPKGGMHEIVKAMQAVAEEQGVQFKFNTPVEKLNVKNGEIVSVKTAGGELSADVIVSSADYHFTETKLLEPTYRNYTNSYWDSRVMAPSSLIFYIGLNKRLSGLSHHNLFFDQAFESHAHDIYSNSAWPENPLFYASLTTQTDPSGAPENCENLFLLIPVAAGLQDTPEIKDRYYEMLMDRLESLTNQEIRSHVVHCRSYAYTDFCNDYNAFKGNAYGLANTLKQTAILKPSLKNKKIKNLYYTGQLTVPGPGVPPSIISGQVVAAEILKKYKV
jgi:phytoene desaturase